MADRTQDPAAFFAEAAQERRTAVDVVADAVRKAIESGVLAPGEKVNEEMLAARLQVSRMPVRQAMRSLESAGLVKLVPHAGAVVSALSADELEELYALRAVLEAVAIARAVPRHTGETLSDLQACLDQSDPAQVSADEYVTMNRRFHSLLYSPSGWHRLNRMIDQIRGNVDRYVRLSVSDPRDLAESFQEHKEMLRACQAGDVARAEELIRHHVNRVGQTVIAKVRQLPQANQ